jgi:hypothetical protein
MKTGGDLFRHMGVDVGGDDAGMAEETFDGADILTILQEVGGV